jgi:hypothetical protein
LRDGCLPEDDVKTAEIIIEAFSFTAIVFVLLYGMLAL